MDMLAQFLVPGVQDSCEAYLAAEAVLGVGGELLQRFGNALEENVEDHLFVEQR